MSNGSENLSNYGIDIVFLEGTETEVTPMISQSWRSLPFTVISFQEPLRDVPWHGCGCIFPEGEYSCADPACWIVPPYCRHYFQRFDEGHKSTWGHFEFMIGTGVDLMQFCNPPRFITGEDGTKLRDLLLQIHGNIAPDPVSFCRKRAAEYHILEILLKHCKNEQGEALELSLEPFILRIFQYIHRNLAKRITIEDLARTGGMSRSSLEKKFRAGTGISPGEYILRCRLREAARLLRRSDLPVKEIAAATGFADVYTFSKAFRRKFHQPPAHFRKSGYYC